MKLRSHSASMAERVVSTLLLIFCILGLMILQTVQANINAMFVFGDSTVDVGNNNYMNNTRAKANFPHYGVDFPSSTATGRFSNGYNTADQIGGSGISDHTGPLLVGKVIPMSTQVKYFAMVRSNMDRLVGSFGASRSLFFISSGSNGMFEYSANRDETELLANLTSSYKNHLEALYNLGARKFGIVSILPLGCCPSQRLRNQTLDCYEVLSNISRKFYSVIGAVLEELQMDLPEMKYALGNAYDIVAYTLQNPQPLQFKELKVARCGGVYNGEYVCNQTVPFCANHSDYLFWDGFHTANKKFATPINFQQLAEI